MSLQKIKKGDMIFSSNVDITSLGVWLIFDLDSLISEGFKRDRISVSSALFICKKRRMEILIAKL